MTDNYEVVRVWRELGFLIRLEAHYQVAVMDAYQADSDPVMREDWLRVLCWNALDNEVPWIEEVLERERERAPHHAVHRFDRNEVVDALLSKFLPTA